MQNFKYIGAGIAVIGMIGTGIGQGVTGAKMVEAIARNPDAVNKLRLYFVLGMGITETTALYSFVISLIILFA